MHRKIVAVWMSLVMVFSIYIIVDPSPKTKVCAETSVPSGHITSNTIWTLSGSPYYIEGDVYIDEGVNLTIEPGVEVKFNGSYNLYIDGCLNATGAPENLINFTSNSSTPNPGDWQQIRTNQDGFVKMIFCNLSYGYDPLYLEHSNKSIIKNNIFYNSNHCALIILYSNDVNISNNLFLSNKMIGVSQYCSSNNTYYNNSFFDTARYSLLIDGEQQAHFDNTVDISNTVNNKPVYYFHNLTNTVISSLDAGMIEVAWSNNITLSDCKIIDADPIILNLVRDSNILNCNSSGNFIGFWLLQSDRNHIDSNFAYSNRWFGIQLYKFCKNNTVINNTASGNERSGIQIYFSSNWNNITGNVVSNNLDHGIDLFSGICKYNNISRNVIINSSEGIGISYGQYNDMCYNRIILNQFGIMLSNAKFNKIFQNNISESKAIGISASGPFSPDQYNEIYLNNIYSNICGINFGVSKKNIIYNNNFINNQPTQASEMDSGNYFNETYPISGNYWSDYIGDDTFSGPLQNEPESDGIGDDPYEIDSDSRDYYPLIQPHPKAGIPPEICIYLKHGWNLISIPFIQPNTRLGAVLGPIEGSYDSVLWYNVSDVYDRWKHNHTSKLSHLNDLHSIDHTMGFWIHITEPDGVLFEYSGNQPTLNQTISLHPGWNLIGYPSLGIRNRTDALNNIDFGTDVDAIWTYNATTPKWKEISASDNFEVGRGYWIHSKVTKTWIVPL